MSWSSLDELVVAHDAAVGARERNELLLAAGFAPTYPHTDLDDPRLTAVRTALVDLAPPRPRQLPPHHLGFAVPLHLSAGDPDNRELRLVPTLTHFGTATDVTIAELRLEAFLPADEATSAALTELVTW